MEITCISDCLHRIDEMIFDKNRRPLSIDGLESIRSYIKSQNNEIFSECVFLPLQEIDNIIEELYKEIDEEILNDDLDSLRGKILCWYKDINTNLIMSVNMILILQISLIMNQLISQFLIKAWVCSN